jgi:hypothetical protein
VTNLARIDESKHRPRYLRRPHTITARGKTATYAVWASELGIDENVLRMRKLYGWSDEEAIGCKTRTYQLRVRPDAPSGRPEAASWYELPWEDDDWAWYATACHPEGLGLAEVGALIGLCKERVRQIQMSALNKLRRGLAHAFHDHEDSSDLSAEWLRAAFTAFDEERYKARCLRELSAPLRIAAE